MPLRQKPPTNHFQVVTGDGYYALTFHMIKIPSSTDKVRKEVEREAEEEIGSCLLTSLSTLWDAESMAAAAAAETAASGALRSRRGWGYTSVVVSSPLMTCSLLCLCEPFHPDPRERGLNSEQGRPTNVPPPRRFSSSPFCASTVFKSPSEPSCCWGGQSLDNRGVESVCLALCGATQTDNMRLNEHVCSLFSIWISQKKRRNRSC